MALLKLGKRVHAKNRTLDEKGKIVGKIKWENPFSFLKKKGWNYIIHTDSGREISVDTDHCTEITPSNH